MRLATAFLVLALVGAASTVRAEEPRCYMLVSEIARDVAVVTYEPAIGSRLGQNAMQRMPIPGATLDRAALTLLRAQVELREPRVRVVTVEPIDSDLFDARHGFGEGGAAGVPDDLAAEARRTRCGRLIVLTRHLADASVQTRNAKIGSGRYEGVGFYLDNSTLVTDLDERRSARGLIAPFVHIRATLVDTGDNRVLRSRTFAHGEAMAALRANEAVHPWEALDAQTKMRVLANLMSKAIEQLAGELLAP